MKTFAYNPFAVLTAITFSVAGCASSGEVSDNTGMEPTQVVVTETETGVYTNPQSETAVVVTETDVVADTTVMLPERQNVVNRMADYEDMFDDVDDTDQYNVLELAKMDANLSTFVNMVQLSGLAPSLQVAENITIFAPTNAAFNEIPAERLAELIDPANRTELIELLQLHSVSSEIYAAQLQDNSFIDRGEQDDIVVNTDMGGQLIYIGGAPVVKANVEASNGVLHVIDGIIETTDNAGPGLE